MIYNMFRESLKDFKDISVNPSLFFTATMMLLPFSIIHIWMKKQNILHSFSPIYFLLTDGKTPHSKQAKIYKYALFFRTNFSTPIGGVSVIVPQSFGSKFNNPTIISTNTP